MLFWFELKLLAEGPPPELGGGVPIELLVLSARSVNEVLVLVATRYSDIPVMVSMTELRSIFMYTKLYDSVARMC